MEMQNDQTLNNDEEFEFNESTGELHPAGTFKMRFDSFCKAKQRNDDGTEEPDPYGRMAVTLESPKKRQEEGEHKGEKFKLTRKMKPSTHPKSLMRKFLFAVGIDVGKIKPQDIKLAPRIGTPVFVTVEHQKAKDSSDREFAVITGFMPLPDEEEEDAKTAAAAKEAEKAARRKKLEEDDEE